MRYIQNRGLRKIQNQLTLLFACMNLKKLALWKKKNGLLPPPPPFTYTPLTLCVS